MILKPSKHYSLASLEEFVDANEKISLDRSAFAEADRGQKLIRQLAYQELPIYGVNTGFGKLAQVRISKEDLVQLQLNLVRSHACGVGEPLSESGVRRLLLIRLLSLGKGFSGVSKSILERHLVYLNRKLTPKIPILGSVGASGDLAPLAHLALTFIGEGEFVQGCYFVPAEKVLRTQRLKPLALGPKEGLALVNGTQFSLALALEARRQLASIIPWMEISLLLSVEAHRGTREVFAPRIHRLKNHPFELAIATRIYKALASSPHMKGHVDCDLVQDAYSFRCSPQILGAAYSTLEKADELLEGELNSVSDNPLVFTRSKELLSCGHFHAQAVSMAADLMSLSVATMANLIERRIDQMINPGTTRGQAFYADRPGVESGLMIVHTTAAALTSEIRGLSHPASTDTIPTNGNQEDHVSMAPWASRKVLRQVQLLRKVLSCEILSAVRGCIHESTATGLAFSKPVEETLAFLAEKIPSLFLAGDRIFAKDLDAIDALLTENMRSQSGKFSNTFDLFVSRDRI